MRRKQNLILATAVLIVLGLRGSACAFSGSGSGTEADAYVITTVQQLQEMEKDLDAWYELGCDIDASETQNWNGGSGFKPIGNDESSFTGTFDGRGRAITGLYIDRPSDGRVGLFGRTSEGAEIMNVELAKVNISGYYMVGALVGENYVSAISNCGVISGNVAGSFARVGGLVGNNTNAGAILSQCYSDVSVAGGQMAGGLVGAQRYGAIIYDSYARGDVSSSVYKIGGLVGDNMDGHLGTLVKRCYSSGKVTGTGGGLIGYNWQGGITQDSYWDINTSGKTSSKGGIGKTTTEMMQQATFVNWDFVNIWDIVENKTYPLLRPLLKPALVTVDIKPTSCPNPLNVKIRGVLPVAILGSEDFDVNSIDIASIRLAGIAAIRSSFEDVGTPLVDANECECSTEGPDGFLDLTLKFETQRIVEAIGQIIHGDELVLELTGVLSDETPIEGSDCVIIRGKHKPLNEADFNGDGIVDMADFATFTKNWLQ